MKTKYLFFITLLSLCILSCRDKDQDPNVLPEATQHGANTGGALVDGKVWVASTKKTTDTDCEVYNGHTLITIHLIGISNNSSISIIASIENFEINKTYILFGNPDTGPNFANYFDANSKGYSTQPNSEYMGKIKITALNMDLSNAPNYISGTFEFKAVDKDGNTVNITEGRFDKKFL
ncbi:MAG: DUF6252 family protein [Bergeyella sp.]